MIQNAIGVLAVLILIEAVVLFLSENTRTKFFFKFLPAMFWIYFLPMVFSTLGVLPNEHPVYQKITSYFLPASLILLLLTTDLYAIFKLGKTALIMMLAASLSVVVSGPAIVFLFQKWLPAGSWMGFGVLSASWTGGSANMIAVKEITQTPDGIFLPMVVVDTLVSYSWMGFLIFLVPYQERFDRWNHSNREVIDQVHQRIEKLSLGQPKFHFGAAVLGILVAVIGAWLSIQLAGFCPKGGGMSGYTWSIILASTLGILLSLTPVRKWGSSGASKAGYLLLYFVLTSIGVRANLLQIVSAPLLILAGLVWVFFHGLILLGVGRLLKVPLCLTATASQANIGGPASAPVVAALYEPVLAPVGLLLGIFGNVIGTYLGLLCFELCRMIR